MAAEKEWSLSLIMATGHQVWHSPTIGHHHLPATITLIQQTLADRTEKVYRSWTPTAMPTLPCLNHKAVHGGIMMAGFAFWGEINGPPV